MNSKENSELKDIAKHVGILNDEVGKVKNDVKWMKKILFYIAGIVSIAVGKIIFFG